MGNKIQRIYIGSNQVRPPYWDYTPTSNTLVYYRMREDLNDYSGNNRNLTGTATFNNNKATLSSGINAYGGQILNGVTGAFTVSMWTFGSGTNSIGDADSGGPQWYCRAGGNSGNRNGNFIINGGWRRCGNQSAMGTSSDFVLLTCVYNGSELYAYKNGVQFGSTASVSGNIKGSATKFFIESGTWGQIIVEKGAWSVSDIQTYYNNSKVNYDL